MKAFSSLVKLGCIIQQTGSRPLRERERYVKHWNHPGGKSSDQELAKCHLATHLILPDPTRSASPQVTPNGQEFPIPG